MSVALSTPDEINSRIPIMQGEGADLLCSFLSSYDGEFVLDRRRYTKRECYQ